MYIYIQYREGQSKTVGAPGETLPFLDSCRKAFSLAKQRGVTAPRGSNRVWVGAPDICLSEKLSDRKASSHKLHCRASFQPLSKLVPRANAKWRNSHLGNDHNPMAPEICPLWCGLCIHPGFLPVKRDLALSLKGMEMFVLHWHLLSTVF